MEKVSCIYCKVGLMSEGNFSFSSFSAFLSKDMVGPEEGINAPVKKGSTVKLTIFHSVEVLLKVTLNYCIVASSNARF